jgi:hypothetical protein
MLGKREEGLEARDYGQASSDLDDTCNESKRKGCDVMNNRIMLAAMALLFAVALSGCAGYYAGGYGYYDYPAYGYYGYPHGSFSYHYYDHDREDFHHHGYGGGERHERH